MASAAPSVSRTASDADANAAGSSLTVCAPPAGPFPAPSRCPSSGPVIASSCVLPEGEIGLQVSA